MRVHVDDRACANVHTSFVSVYFSVCMALHFRENTIREMRFCLVGRNVIARDQRRSINEEKHQMTLLNKHKHSCNSVGEVQNLKATKMNTGCN